MVKEYAEECIKDYETKEHEIKLEDDKELKIKKMSDIKVGQVGWFWCNPLGKSWKVLDRLESIDLKDTHPFHTYTDSYYESFQPSTDDELSELGLCRKEKLDKAKDCLLETIKDLRHYQCMDNDEWNKTNSWLTALKGIERIEKILEGLK